jgi:hypothetical protein
MTKNGERNEKREKSKRDRMSDDRTSCPCTF